jgi:hypothetical protein
MRDELTKMQPRLPAGQERVLVKLCGQLGSIMQVAFQPQHVAKGFKLAGMVPFAPRQMLTQCRALRKLNHEESAQIIALLPQLTTAAAAAGELTEAKMDELKVWTQTMYDQDSHTDIRYLALRVLS